MLTILRGGPLDILGGGGGGCLQAYRIIESHGRVVTHWPGSQEVGGSIPAATKIVRCKNLAFNIGVCLPWLGYHVKPLVPCISEESSPSM